VAPRRGRFHVRPAHHRLGGAAALVSVLVVSMPACAQRSSPTAAEPITDPTVVSMVAATDVQAVATARGLGWLAPDARTQRITLVAGGDILIHQRVWESALEHGGGVAFDFGPVFEHVAPVISAADLALCHLEVPLSLDNARLESYPRFSAPFELADAIAGAGYDGCSVASNHVLDQGAAGIDATLGHLDRVGLGHAGAARTADEAVAIARYEVRGRTVAHLAYTYGFNGLQRPPGEEWRASLIDPSAILADAARARQGGADLVVVSLHWGDEYVHAPSAYQLDRAAALAPSPDIDVVIGHHAHVVQPVVQIGGTWVAYGLGNQVSNMLQPERRDGALLWIAFEAAPGEPFVATSVEYLPTWVEVPGHRVVVAPADSWARTAAELAAGGGPLRPMTRHQAAGVPQ
jgi:poly-gamma-glutamate capsule biosynthesis protein CapA/YwtB (metallophosphatase superfamily)